MLLIHDTSYLQELPTKVLPEMNSLIIPAPFKLIFFLLFFCLFTSEISFAQDSLVPVTYYHENGKVSSEGFLRKGKPDGYWKSYHVSGVIKTEGNRKNYELDGVWKFYDTEGQLNVSIEYFEGKKEGERLTYVEGELLRRENFIQDRKQGFSYTYYSSERVQLKIPFEDDLENGLAYELDTLGKIITLLTYKKGVLTKKQPINRKDASGRKQGIWMDFYPDLSVQSDGPYTNDLKNGLFKFYLPDGSLHRSERWVMGVLMVDAEEVEKIELKREIDPNTGTIAKIGAYLSGKPQGVHREYNPQGEVIGGQLYNKGILLAEGITDEQGRRQGPWKFFYEDGELRSEGSYKDNLRVGKWKYYFLDGKIEQEGRYANDNPDGTWIWYFDNGQVRKEQEYVRGLEDGNSVEYDYEGKIITKGKYVEGMKEGEWFFELGDYREEGTYYDDERTGTWKHFYALDGTLKFKGDYQNGLEEGKHVWYYPNGRIDQQGSYKSGLKNGIWEFFNESGNKYLTIQYRMGVEIKYNGVKITYGKRGDKSVGNTQ